jgi:hypothetical protein
VDCYNHFSGEKLAKLAILGLTISFSGLRHFDHLSDFLRFQIWNSPFIYRKSVGLEVYTLRKSYFQPYFSLGLQMLISSLILLPLLVQLELESI